MTCSIQVVDSAWFFGQMLLLHYDRESSAQLFVGFVAVIDEVTTDLIACRSVVDFVTMSDRCSSKTLLKLVVDCPSMIRAA